MIIGLPKEIKANENRVAITPGGVNELTKLGHTVVVQSEAGAGSGFCDEDYKKSGGQILSSLEEIYQRAEMIVKVREAVGQEYGLVKKKQILFTYFDLASSQRLTEEMIKSGSICIAYESVEKADRSLPLLVPMSEVAG